MSYVVWLVLSCGASCVLAWSLGVRRERGRQARRDQIREASGVRRGGIKLRRISVRR